MIKKYRLCFGLHPRLKNILVLMITIACRVCLHFNWNQLFRTLLHFFAFFFTKKLLYFYTKLTHSFLEASILSFKVWHISFKMQLLLLCHNLVGPDVCPSANGLRYIWHEYFYKQYIFFKFLVYNELFEPTFVYVQPWFRTLDFFEIFKTKKKNINKNCRVSCQKEIQNFKKTFCLLYLFES